MNRRSISSVIAYVMPLRMIYIAVIISVIAVVLYYFTPLSIIYPLACIISSIMYITGFFVITAKLLVTLGKIKQNNKSDEVINDFLTGGHAFNDNMILGEKYIFGKNQGTIITYDSIASIYQHIYVAQYTGTEKLRLFIAIDKNGKRRYLCKLRRWGDDENEFENMLQYLKMRNPDIQIGTVQPLKEDIIRQMLDYLRA